MAFDFLGTFNEDQLTELNTFLIRRKKSIKNQSNHIVVEINRLKIVKDNLENSLKKNNALIDDNNVLIIQRLVKKEPYPNKFQYELEERKLFDELLLMEKTTVTRVLNDQTESELMYRLKKPFIEEIKFQRENLENKIRKLGDKIEQLEELRALKIIAINETDLLLSKLRELLSLKNTVKTSVDVSVA